MAETGERPDVTPYTLGQLSDVDSGTPPSVGDALVWDGTEWGGAAALVSSNGPAVETWQTYIGGGMPAVVEGTTYGRGTTEGAQILQRQGGWPEAFQQCGHIVQDADFQVWHPDTPGRYRLYSEFYGLISGGSPTNPVLTTRTLHDPVLDATWFGDPIYYRLVNVGGGFRFEVNHYLDVEFCQEQIDAGGYPSGVKTPYFKFDALGGATVSFAAYVLVAMRLSPGRDTSIWSEL